MALPPAPGATQASLIHKPVTAKIPLYSTSHIQQTNVSVMYQGPPGSGKTHCMATWPQPFFLYFDTNLSTLAKFDDIPFVTVQDWAEVERVWIPAIKNRRLTEYVQSFVDEQGAKPYANYKVRSLCIDSLTFFVNKNVLELGDGGAKSLGYDGWDQYYGRLHRLVTVATQATLPVNADPSKESYHVLASVHEDRASDSEGNLQGISPSVQGKMRGHLTAFFNAVLLTQCEVKSRDLPNPDKSQPPERLRERHFSVHSVSPDRFREAKDQVSGGRFGTLPVRCGGTWPELNSYWNIEPTTKETPL